MIYKDYYINNSPDFYGNDRWYIMDMKQNFYLHKDKQFHQFCGLEGFWKTEFEAMEMIHEISVLKSITDFLKEEDFEI